MADKRIVKSLNDTFDLQRFVDAQILSSLASMSRAAHKVFQRRPLARQSATDPPCAPRRGPGGDAAQSAPALSKMI
jgi:hypothetical protein